MDVAQVKAGCEVLAAQARRSGRPVPKSLASPGDVATPDDHGAFFRGERQVLPHHQPRIAPEDVLCTLATAVVMCLLCCRFHSCPPWTQPCSTLMIHLQLVACCLSILSIRIQVFAGPSGVRVGSSNGASASSAGRP